jgi:hypothetical protein
MLGENTAYYQEGGRLRYGKKKYQKFTKNFPGAREADLRFSYVLTSC